ncbi:MAG: hypothetical protein MJ109_06625 [Kiritimatiellae bacterium]|nr:hypothetical protein [Kiritimatiellia bacterium]
MKTLDPEILDFYDTEVCKMIVEKYDYSEQDALVAFLGSKTYKMLINPEMWMCQFGPAAIFDMWECEHLVGTPLKSSYLRAS